MKEHMKEIVKANPDKYNDLEKTGNIYGSIPENTSKESNNGRTPINPVAQNPMRFRVGTAESPHNMSNKDTIEQA